MYAPGFQTPLRSRNRPRRSFISVIPCSDIEAICAFYVRVLNMRRIDFGEGRVALGFGRHKINLQPAGWETVRRARNHIEGTADFCLITDTPMAAILDHLKARGATKRRGWPDQLGLFPRSGWQSRRSLELRAGVGLTRSRPCVRPLGGRGRRSPGQSRPPAEGFRATSGYCRA